MNTLRLGRAATLRGEMRPPSDKSLTHRALMFGAIASSPSEILAPLGSEDAEATRRILGQLGVHFEESEEALRVLPAPWTAPSEPLDCGNSGTTMRLMAGLLASRPLTVALTGDASLSRRPMGRVAEPLRQMGAMIEGDRAPLKIVGGDLHGIRYETPVASAQIKSCLLLAGLRAEGETWVREPAPSRDHTERMLAGLGVPPMREGEWIGVRRTEAWAGFRFRVPGDISSAAFFLVAAALLPESRLLVRELSVNPTRTGILDVLRAAGVPFALHDPREELGEPVADLEIWTPSTLQPFEIAGELVPRLIDEIPVLAVLATQAEGTTVIRDARELRVKESDRIERVTAGLRAMGAQVEAREDGMVIEGPTPLRGATIDAEGDHRIGMAFAIAGLIAEGETVIENAHAIASSFPTFSSELYRLAGF